MREVVCDTPPLQYLHQTNLLHLLPDLAERVYVPAAVVHELDVGRDKGFQVPDVRSLAWAQVREPLGKAVLPLAIDLGPGESEVLALAMETPGCVVLTDDAFARRVARILGLAHSGTLGILLDAKKAGLIPAVAPIVDQLQSLGFRLGTSTRDTVLRLSGEME